MSYVLKIFFPVCKMPLHFIIFLIIRKFLNFYAVIFISCFLYGSGLYVFPHSVFSFNNFLNIYILNPSNHHFSVRNKNVLLFWLPVDSGLPLIIYWSALSLPLSYTRLPYVFVCVSVSELFIPVYCSVKALVSGYYSDYSFISQCLIKVVPSHHFCSYFFVFFHIYFSIWILYHLVKFHKITQHFIENALIM